jgi:hypothetical protein
MARGRGRRKRKSWSRLGDEALLNLRLCDLGLRIEGTVLERRIERLWRELGHRGIPFRPHCWLSGEWFSPDDAPGIAIPFYLAHPRLARLEFKQMYAVEGRSEASCMQLLRHEAGHALDTAFQLHRRDDWRRVFGRWSRPYPEWYRPNPGSRKHVFHLDWWYAQSHPAEDFAETFAVWLRPRRQWRERYAGWPALRKLEYVDELMEQLADRRPARRSRRQIEPVARDRRTLREYYRAKRKSYGVNVPEIYDSGLRRLFSKRSEAKTRRRTAAAFLARFQPELCRLCARGTGKPPHVIAQFVQEVIQRCREMKLCLDRPEREARLDVAIFVTVQVLNWLHEGRHRITV